MNLSEEELAQDLLDLRDGSWCMTCGKVQIIVAKCNSIPSCRRVDAWRVSSKIAAYSVCYASIRAACRGEDNIRERSVSWSWKRPVDWEHACTFHSTCSYRRPPCSNQAVQTISARSVKLRHRDGGLIVSVAIVHRQTTHLITKGVLSRPHSGSRLPSAPWTACHVMPKARNQTHLAVGIEVQTRFAVEWDITHERSLVS